jgi:predicted outer membrane repeat protein
MIWVADGVYKPDEGAGKTPNDVNATFQLINSVKIYGGFAGNETAVKERDWENNLTILSGDIGLVDNNSDNSYHVVTGSSTNSTALLDGFTITDGNARGSFPQDRGGGMYINGGSPTLRNCTFTVNYASTEGGGIYHRYGSSPILANCRFNNNTAQYGGAICAYDNCDSKIINCTFTDNSADWWGGGLFLNFDCNPTVVNCIFIGNSAAEGGGMYNHTLSDPIVANCTFWDNSVDYYGGGICNEVSSDPIVRNCIVWANTSTYATVQDAQIYGGVPIVTFSCIQDSDPDDGSIPFGGAANNNIDDNPLFTDSANEDLRLSYNSPCVETANNTGVPADAADIDGDGVTIELVPRALDGRSRFIDGDCDRIETVDMGAYEFGWIYIGDLDGDCDIDLTDFAVTAKHWLEGK